MCVSAHLHLGLLSTNPRPRRQAPISPTLGANAADSKHTAGSFQLLGEDLAAAVLRLCPLPPALVEKFLLIGYNPHVRADSGDANHCCSAALPILLHTALQSECRGGVSKIAVSDCPRRCGGEASREPGEEAARAAVGETVILLHPLHVQQVFKEV